MRNLKYVAVLLSILCCAGCSNVENVPESEVMQEPERYTISLGVGDGTERCVGYYHLWYQCVF